MMNYKLKGKEAGDDPEKDGKTKLEELQQAFGPDA
jgi:hypothetical protein